MNIESLYFYSILYLLTTVVHVIYNVQEHLHYILLMLHLLFQSITVNLYFNGLFIVNIFEIYSKMILLLK